MPEALAAPAPSPKASVPSQAPPAPAAPPPAPKPTPMQRAQASLENFIDKTPEPKAPTKTNEPKQPPPTDTKAGPEPTEPSAEPQPKEGVQEPPKEPGSGKENPWKLVESYKKKSAALEKELSDFRGKSNLPELESKWKSAEERAVAAEKRAKELADEIRFVNYSKSDEFIGKFQKPYEEACKTAASELAELSIEDSNGQTRQATFNDLLALCNMKLGQARQQAEAWFGSSADDVMAHRREINRLYQDQQKALEDSRANGETRQKEQMQSWDRLRNETTTLWQKFDKEASEKYEFLKPKEGDEEYNGKLEKARETVGKAFSGNALDPRLSPEDRQEIVKAQVAVRNRAIAYSTLRLENTRLKAKLESAEKSLKEFQESEPTAGRGSAAKNGKQIQSVNPMEAAMGRLAGQYVT